ncbi:MAG TPA: hypothetical protein PKL77_09785 [Candidatus Omnitrophota bacterium]|nr:hypothetical protein [Candidatus Omnitrophota bacterium]
MKEDRALFKNYSAALHISNLTFLNSSRIVQKLYSFDTSHETHFEFSFKLQQNRLIPSCRFLNMDSQVYSCKSQLYFLARLELCRKLMKNKAPADLVERSIRAFEFASRTPMNLYFGADVFNKAYLFAFWLIFGGVQKNGNVTFWNYDFKQIIMRMAYLLRCSFPIGILKRNVLNLGIDLGPKEIYYKLYYLCRGNSLDDAVLREKMHALKSIVRQKHFYFFSEMFDAKGNRVKTKLFIEFLEDIVPWSANINQLLSAVLHVTGSMFDEKRLFRVISGIGGRISLMSFENDGTITFYIRSAHKDSYGKK